MENHLIIGLGGTGGKIIRSFRKRIYEEFQSNKVNQVNMSYIWVDSSAKDLNETASWKTMGQSVHLGLSDRVQITGTSGFVFDEIHKYPGISPWIGDKITWQDIQKGIIGDVVGGQRRRLGRFLFASNVENFNKSLDNHVNDMRNTSKNNEVTFHICCGLAGGTGSGSIIDVVTQIRSKFRPDTNNKYLIMLYLQLPEVMPKPGFDSGYYHANGFAALSELNALSTGSYLPYDVSAAAKDDKGKVKRLLQGMVAFNNAYLFTNENEKGTIIDIVSELPVAVSDFLFQKIIASKQASNATLGRFEDAENADASPESMIVDGENIPLRSKRFLSFGIKRVEYPEEEIKEYVAFNYARQASLQFKFNQWSDGIGYVEKPEEEIGLGFLTEIKKPETFEKLLLSDEYLMLSDKITPDNPANKNWRKIEELWSAAVGQFAQDAQKKDKKDWMDELRRLCKQQFDENYRGRGVRNFYQDQQAERKGYARHIRSHIEKLLFNEWRAGVKSIVEIEKYLKILINVTTEKIAGYDEKVSQTKQVVKQKILPQIQENLDVWSKIGFLSDVLGKSEKTFEKQKNSMREYYYQMTVEQGQLFAKDLLMDVNTELSKLLTLIVEFKTLITNSLETIDNAIDSRCKDGDALDSTALIVKLYKTDNVTTITKDFVRNKDNQSNNAKNVREALVALTGDNDDQNFTKLVSVVDPILFIDVFEKVCIESAATSMESLATNDPTFKTLNVNILEKIKMEYGVGDRLESFIKDLIRSSGNFVTFDNDEMRSVGSTPKANAMMLVLPEYNDASNYREKFIEYFKSNVPSEMSFQVSNDVVNNYKSNQLVILTLSSVFPLRYVSNVKFLKEKYDAKMIGTEAVKNKLVLHTEGDGTQFPPLFEQSMASKRLEAIPAVLLARALDIIVEEEDVETGEKELAIHKEDATGLNTNAVYLGKNLLAALDKLVENNEERFALNKLVTETFRDNYKHVDAKTKLKEQIVKIMKGEMLDLCNKNPKNQDYVDFNAAASKFITDNLI